MEAEYGMITHETSVLFDMRAPGFGTAASMLYLAALEMAAFADEIGVDRIDLLEHHASEDGCLPAPFVLDCNVYLPRISKAFSGCLTEGFQS
jgi:hypothetical protein